VRLGGERLEIRSMLTAAPDGMGTEMPGEVHDSAALALSASVLMESVSAAPAAVTWGYGLTEPGASSAWDITGMPLGEFHTRLNFVKRATVDPLLAPGDANFWHAHDFFVNPTVDENATLGSLMAAGESAAAPSSNVSAYWVPSLFNETTGAFVTPLDTSVAYYSVQKPLEPSTIVAMPAGLSIIAGNAMPTERQPTAVVFWNYIGTPTQYDHIPQGDQWQDLPLQAVIMFPQFWDGASLRGTNFKNHMAYDRGGDGGPSSHPYLLPELQLQIHYGRIPRDARLMLTSDAMTADRPGYAPGWSMHADFIHTPWPERDAAGNLYDGFERRVNDALRWPTVAGTDGNAARPNPMGLQQPFTPVPIKLSPTLPATGEAVPPPAEPPAGEPSDPPADQPIAMPGGPDLRLAWPTPEVVMRTGVSVGIHGNVTDLEGVADIRLSLRHESGAYWRPDGTFGNRAWHEGRIVAADGHWRLMVAPPAPGAYALTVIATDTTGATSLAETTFSVIGDTIVAPPNELTPPSPPVSPPPPPDPLVPPPEDPPQPEPVPDPVAPPGGASQLLPEMAVDSAIAAAIAAGRLLPAPAAGDAVPTSFSGSRLTPLVSAGFDEPVPSSDWWSSVVMPVFGNPFSAPLHVHPLTVQMTANGLDFGAPTHAVVTVTGNTTTEYKTPHRFDLGIDLLGGEAADSFAVEGYGDWSFTGRWLGGGSSPTATLAQGSPVLWLEDVDFGRAVIRPQAGGAIVESQSNHAFITIDGRTTLVLAPAGARLEQQAGGVVVRGVASGSLAIALLPDATAETREVFLATAANRPQETRFSWDTSTDPYTIRLRYDVVAEGAGGADSLVAVYPHLARLATGTGRLGAPVSTTAYVSPRGGMELWKTASLGVELPNRGVLPTLPAVLSAEQRVTLAELVRTDPAAVDPTAALRAQHDTYWSGKAMLKLAQLAQLADITNQPGIRDRIITALKASLDDWFTASGQPGDKHFAYNAEWDTIQGYPDSFGSAGDLNDHHFHYGYFIHAAALVGTFDPAWASAQRTMVDLLVADVAGTDTAGTMLPRLRNFSPLAGHSWASGHGAFGSGNNHESSSEAMNFATAVILWGEVSGDPGMTSLGQMLYSVEAEAIAEYWFDRYGTVFPDDFAHESVGMVWGDGGSHATWFSAEPEMIKGINFLPFHGGSFYLAEMARDPAALLAEISRLGGGVVDDWPGIILQYEALVDPAAAVARLAAGGIGNEAGQSTAQTFFWTNVLANVGSPTSSIRGDHPLSAVFQRGGVTTYVAHNTGPRSVTVTFNDGTRFAVAAGATATWQRQPGSTTVVEVVEFPRPSVPDIPVADGPNEPSVPLALVAATTDVSLLVDAATGLAYVQEAGGEPVPIRRADAYWNGHVPLSRGGATLVAAARDSQGRLRVVDVSEWGQFAWILDDSGLFRGEEGPFDSTVTAKELLFTIDLDGDGLVGLVEVSDLPSSAQGGETVDDLNQISITTDIDKEVPSILGTHLNVDGRFTTDSPSLFHREGRHIEEVGLFIPRDSMAVVTRQPALVLGGQDEPWVQVVATTGTLQSHFLAYEAAFRGGVRVASGDMTGDGNPEIIVAPGPNRPGEIRVFTQQGVELTSYRTLAFGRRYRGGVEVAVADVTGDGVADIVAGMSGGGGRVLVFQVNPNAADPVENVPYRSFRGVPGRRRGGVRIAAGDVGTFANGAGQAAAADGRAEIIVALNAGPRGLVRVFDVSSQPRVVQTIRPFGGNVRGELTLSLAAYQAAGLQDILIGAGPESGSVVELYDGGTGGRIARLDAFASFATPHAQAFTAALDLDGDGVVDDIYAVQGRGGSPGVKRFERLTSTTTTLGETPLFLPPPLRIAPIVLRLEG
jgi:hypothetical protein